MKNTFYLLMMILCFGSVRAQELAFDIGYKSIRTNYLQVGLSYRLTDYNDTETAWNVDATFLTDFSRNYIPKIGVQKRFSIFFEFGGNVSTRYFEPTFGLNLLNMLKINVGHTIPFRNNFHRGVTFGVTISFGKEEKYYDYLRLM